MKANRIRELCERISSHGEEAVQTLAKLLNRHVYLYNLGIGQPNLTLEDKTDLIIWDWMEDNILCVSREEKLAHYIWVTLSYYETVRSNFGEDGSPARNTGDQTSWEQSHVVEDIATMGPQNAEECISRTNTMAEAPDSEGQL